MKPTRRNSAFTLIEMVVVIGIIMLLAAILFPVFAQVQEKGRATSCTSNLKQLGVGIQLYNQDFDHRTMPNAQTWKLCPRNLLTPYLKSRQVWICPSETNTNVFLHSNTAADATLIAGDDPPYVSYQLNNQWANKGEAVFVRPTEFIITSDTNPAEGGWTEGNSTDGGLTTDWPHKRASCASSPGPTPVAPCGTQSYLEAEWNRHNGTFNALYIDGHVKTLRASQVTDYNFVRPQVEGG